MSKSKAEPPSCGEFVSSIDFEAKQEELKAVKELAAFRKYFRVQRKKVWPCLEYRTNKLSGGV